MKHTDFIKKLKEKWNLDEVIKTHSFTSNSLSIKINRKNIPDDYLLYINDWGWFSIDCVDFYGIASDALETHVDVVDEIESLISSFPFPKDLIPLESSSYQGDAYVCIQTINKEHYNVIVWDTVSKKIIDTKKGNLFDYFSTILNNED